MILLIKLVGASTVGKRTAIPDHCRCVGEALTTGQSVAAEPVSSTNGRTLPIIAAVIKRTGSLRRTGFFNAEQSQKKPVWRGKAVTLGAVAIMTSACTVMQPHVNVPADYYASPVVFAGDLNPQLARAKVLQQLYMDQVADETLLTNSLAVTAIPLAAAAVAVGITNPGATATRNFLTGTGLGVAAALGVGSFLVDRRRDAIYYGGAKNIYCLALAISPLAIEAGEFEKMWQDVEQLRLNLAAAAAAGVQSQLIAQGNDVYAAGRKLVRETARAGLTFSNELDNINIAVNAQIAREDRTIGDIAAAINVIQNPINIVAPPAIGRTQGGRREPLGLSDLEMRLRRSIELVTAWVAAYQSTVAATADKLQASQCLPATAAGSPPVQPIVIVGNGQGVTIGSPGPGGAGSVITVPPPVQPPPPNIPRPHAPAPIPSTEPPADISNDEMKQLRTVFGLTPTNATLPNSPAFKNKVTEFQRCKGEPATGRLTDKQKQTALSATDACLPRSGAGPGAGTPPGPAPGGNLPAQPPPPPTR